MVSNIDPRSLKQKLSDKVNGKLIRSIRKKHRKEKKVNEQTAEANFGNFFDTMTLECSQTLENKIKLNRSKGNETDKETEFANKALAAESLIKYIEADNPENFVILPYFESVAVGNGDKNHLLQTLRNEKLSRPAAVQMISTLADFEGLILPAEYNPQIRILQSLGNGHKFIAKVDEINTKGEANSLVGSKVYWQTPRKRIKGIVTRTHGKNGRVKVKFGKELQEKTFSRHADINCYLVNQNDKRYFFTKDVVDFYNSISNIIKEEGTELGLTESGCVIPAAGLDGVIGFGEAKNLTMAELGVFLTLLQTSGIDIDVPTLEKGKQGWDFSAVGKYTDFEFPQIISKYWQLYRKRNNRRNQRRNR